VLQDTMIIRLRKVKINTPTIKLASSTDPNIFTNLTEQIAPYDVVVSGAENYVHLVTSQEEIKVLKKVLFIGKSLSLIELKMKTGIIVDFRHQDLLRNFKGDHIVPLFYS
jgi:adenine-specific DNA-methyltransferase